MSSGGESRPHRFFQIQTQTGWSRILTRMADWCSPEMGWVSLDVGCGPGLLPSLLAERGCLAIGVDLSLAELHQGRLYPLLAQANAGSLPFPRATFHLITASNLLFLLPDPLPVLQEFRRVLRASAQLVVLNPSEKMSLAAAAELADSRRLSGLARESILNWASMAERHARWSEPELQALFSDASFKMIETELVVGSGLARLARAVSDA